MINEQIKELLNLYVSDNKQYDKTMTVPHTHNGLTFATERHSLIVLKGTEYGEFTEHTMKIETIIAPHNCDKLFTLLSLQRIIEQLPKKDEVITLGEPCPECNDKGVVEWEYTDSEGETHYQDFECPICEGRGMTYEKHTGREITDEDSSIDIGGCHIRAKYLLQLEKTMRLLNLEEAVIKNLKHDEIFIVELTEETEKRHLIQSIVQKILDENLIEIETIADEERDEETIIARLHILTKNIESQ